MHKPRLVGLRCDGCCNQGVSFWGVAASLTISDLVQSKLQERSASVSSSPEAEAMFHGTLPYRPHFPWFTRPRHGKRNFSYVGKSSKPKGKKSKTWETTLYLWLRCTAARPIFKEKKIDSSSFLMTFCHPKPTYKQEICHNE